MKTPPESPNERNGEKLKRDALELLDLRRRSIVLQGRRAMILTLLEREYASADDVRRAVQLPAGVSPKCFGAVPGPLKRAGIIRPIGFAPTLRAVAHARPLSQWHLVNRAAAERWIAAHPVALTSDDPAAGTLFASSTKKPGASTPGSN